MLDQVSFVVVVVDNPLSPFFTHKIFPNWVLYSALKSSVKILFVSSKQNQSQLLSSVSEKFENVFEICEKITIPKRYSMKKTYDKFSHYQLKGPKLQKAEKMIRNLYEKWIFRICKIFILYIKYKSFRFFLFKASNIKNRRKMRTK